MVNFLEKVNSIIWGVPVLLLILAVGGALTIGSKFAQLRFLPAAIQKFIQSLRGNNKQGSGISGYKALCTALAATVGTGNIAGVAGAIAIGGPGVVFWMWVCAFLGMVTKMAEVILAVVYRKRTGTGEYIGGPMYMIHIGLSDKYHWLALAYAFFGVVAAFGVGNATQINAVVEGIRVLSETAGYTVGPIGSLLLGVTLAALITAVFRQGAEGIGSWAEALVPAASVIYILFSSGVLLMRFDRIPAAFSSILSGAFSPQAVTGGLVGSFFLTLRVGASRGVFTNEAGMGTASIAHAGANVSHPMEQGLMGIIEVFLDTIVICTMTALVILCSGVSIPYGTDPGIRLTMDAFATVYGSWSQGILTLLVCIFAFATILGWGLYGIRCAQYLFGEKIWNYFLIAQAGMVILGVLLNTSLIWVLAEILNGLMALPNLTALLLLMPEFFKIVRKCENKKAYRSR